MASARGRQAGAAEHPVNWLSSGFVNLIAGAVLRRQNAPVPVCRNLCLYD